MRYSNRNYPGLKPGDRYYDQAVAFHRPAWVLAVNHAEKIISVKVEGGKVYVDRAAGNQYCPPEILILKYGADGYAMALIQWETGRKARKE